MVFPLLSMIAEYSPLICVKGSCTLTRYSSPRISRSEKFVSTYKARQTKLIENFRRDYAQFAPSNGIAFVDATIADTVYPGSKKHVWAEYEKINAAKNEIAVADDRTFIIDVNANDIVCTGEPDYYHRSSVSVFLRCARISVKR